MIDNNSDNREKAQLLTTKEINHVFNGTNHIVQIFAPGTFSYYIYNHEIHSLEYVHPDVEKLLGIKPEDFSPFILASRIPEPDKKMYDEKLKLIDKFFIKRISSENILNYKAIFSVKVNIGNTCKQLVCQLVVLSLNDNNKINHSLNIFLDLDFIGLEDDHKVSFIANSGGPSWYGIDPLQPEFNLENYRDLFTRQEKNIIKLMSQGLNTSEIADYLHLSESTDYTHRKNILNKTSCKNSTELVVRCARLGLI